MQKHLYIQGFTLIELLITITIFVLLITVSMGLFLTTVVGQDRVSSSIVVKQNGNQSLSQMLTMIRNSLEVSACSSSSLTLRSRDNGTTQFFLENNRIASNSGVYLTAQELQVTSGPSFSCTTDAEGNVTAVTVTFTLRKGDPAINKARDVVSSSFTGTAGLRRY